MLNLLIATCLVPTITLESVGMRAHELVTAFAKQSGEKLVCSPSVANEPLVISLNTSDFETAKKHLAWAVSGAWRQNEDESFWSVLHQPLPSKSELMIRPCKAVFQS